MAQTGDKVIGTVVSAANWTYFTTTYLNSSNNTYATVNGSTARPTSSRNFNFAMPRRAIITGITVIVEMSAGSPSGTGYAKVRLSKNAGTNWGNYTAEQSVAGTTDTDKTFTCDLTGLDLKPQDVNDNTNFYIDVTGRSNSGSTFLRVDYIRAYITYNLHRSNIA